MIVKLKMLRWKLKEIMARHNIKGNDLAKEMNLTEAAVSNLRNSRTIPRVGGEKLDLLATCLSRLANEKIVFADLYEESQSPTAKSQTKILI